MKVLFITRKYPPRVGGMEQFSYELYRNLPAEKRLVASSQGSRLAIIWLAPWLLLRGLLNVPGCDLIFMADGVLAPVGWLLKLITRRPVFLVIHGLELTYSMPQFSRFMSYFYQRMDRVITVSDFTKEMAVKAGMNPVRITVIPNGVNAPATQTEYARKDLETIIGQDVTNKIVLLTVGRLVKRKGVADFVQNVFSQLPSNFIYIVAGEGPEKARIAQAALSRNLANRVILLGKVPDDIREALFQTANLFIMPNISVTGDMEGFGIVAIEAAVRGLPVIATKVEGIPSAIVDGENGFLVAPGDNNQYVRKIVEVAGRSDIQYVSSGVAAYTKKYYNWKHIGHQYLEEFKQYFEHAAHHS
ncbi:MAG: glycosyltransferase family 4 protein [bacterium]|nr:glycosyltransferase family 4 protein [bacterium]